MVERFGVAVLCVSVLASQAYAQESSDRQGADRSTMSLDQLLATDVRTVVGASRYQQHVSEAPASITIVTADEIESFGYRTLSDVLRGVRGFYVTYDRNYTYLGVRGFSRPGDYNSRILVLIDGHRLNDNIYDSVLMGTDFPLDVELIERVEVVRGPVSTVYGTNAFFGVVNVVTRQHTGPAQVSGSIEAGSLGSVRSRASASGTVGGAVVTGSVSGYRSDGQDRIDYPTLGVSAEKMDHDEAWRAFVRLQKGAWHFTALGSTREKQIPTGAYDSSFEDGRSATTDARAFLDASFERTVNGFAVAWRTGLDWYRYDGTYILTDEDALNREYSRGTWLGTSATVSRRMGRHYLSGGLDLRGDLVQRQVSRLDDAYVLDHDRPQRTYGWWVSDDFKVSSSLMLHGGVGHDYVPGFGISTSFRSAAIFRPTVRDTIKLLYGSAFRAPNAFERFYYEEGEEAILRPEKVRTGEVVLERQLTDRVRVLASAFRSTSRGLITMVDDETNEFDFAYANLQDARTRGLELETELRPTAWLDAMAGYTYQRGRTEGDHDELSNSPRHLAQGRVRASVGPVVLGLEAVHVGSRLAVNGETTPRGTLTNLTVTSGRSLPSLRLSLSLHNLFGVTLVDPGRPEHLQSGIVQDGRTVRLKATWGF